ncbi:MAG: hypothetical protein HGA78_04335 [Nitrospirales bacterium]|nr:hypothetical protein [Nitrospirales bacterium]
MKGLLAFIVVVGIGASVGAIVVGGKTFDGTVVEHPYDSAMRWDKSHHEKADLGWSARIDNPQLTTGKNGISLSLRGKDGSPLSGASATVKITRVSTTSYDRKYELRESGNGVYNADVDLPLYGHWGIEIGVTKDGHTVVFNEDVYAEKQGG